MRPGRRMPSRRACGGRWSGSTRGRPASVTSAGIQTGGVSIDSHSCPWSPSVCSRPSLSTEGTAGHETCRLSDEPLGPTQQDTLRSEPLDELPSFFDATMGIASNEGRAQPLTLTPEN